MTRLRQRLIIGAGTALLLLAVGGAWWASRHDQRADSRFQPASRPAAFGPDGGPRVLIDAAHHESHTASGRFAPFAALARADGFVVRENERPFSAAALADARVLVVADALGARWGWLPGAASSAFTEAEEAAVEEWVRSGGSLLLVADQDPAAAAARALAARFGVAMSGGRVFDPSHADTLGRTPSWVEFRREDGGVQSHPVTDGGGAEQRVRRVVAFTGQSLGVPSGATAILALPPTAREKLGDDRVVSAAGRAQAVALWHGRGRVLVLADAAMLTALTTESGGERLGLTWPGTDDERFALNSVRWLAGVPR